MSSRVQLPLYVQDHFTVDGEIAKGKYGVVYRCRENATGTDVAVKVMMKRHNKKEDVEREVSIMKELNHPNILQFISFVPDGSTYILVTELLNGGELFDYCVSKDYVDEAEAVLFISQILSGLEHMHQRNICHLDLKPENIVLKDVISKELKIIDFGTCQNLSKGKGVKAMAGTPEFIAPEVVNYDPVTCAADMWAIGVIAFCLLTGCSPFLGDNDSETIQNVTLGEYDFPETDPEEGYEDISGSAKDFIINLLYLDPKERLTSSAALEHKWIKKSMSRQASRINTDRLKRLRRRRKLLAAIQAVRISVGLLRSFSRPQSVSEVPVSSDRRGTQACLSDAMSLPKSAPYASTGESFMSNGSSSSQSPFRSVDTSTNGVHL